MSNISENIIQNLKDAGCDAQETAKILKPCDRGRISEAIQYLRRHRLIIMEELHKSQFKVDCLDFLVYHMEKQEKQE